MQKIKTFLASKTGSSTSHFAAAVLLIAGLSLLGVRVLSSWSHHAVTPEVATNDMGQGPNPPVDRTPTGSIVLSTAATTVLDPCTTLRK